MKNNGIKKFNFLAVIILMSLTAKSQSNTLWHYNVEGQSLLAPANKLPFWLRVNQAGSIPLAGTSVGFIGNIYRSYDTSKHQFIRWGAGVEARANVGNTANLLIIQAYIKLKKGIFQLKAGRTRDITGLIDTTLSSGAFSISGNALGIPKVELSIPDYYSLPFWNKLFSIKLNYAFGWLGNTRLTQYSLISKADTYFQQNSLYIRVGKPHWKLKLFGGINHNVMYGHDRQIFGSDFTLSNFQSFIYAAIGKTYHPPVVDYNGVQSKVGNHIGSIDFSAQYEFHNIRLMAYRQNLYDVGAIAHLANIVDGVNGISLTNKKVNNSALFQWKKALLEFVYTKNQAGGFAASEKTSSGDEDYYNNYIYADGWSYHNLNLGNPLLTDRTYARSGLVNDPNDHIIDTRVIALNAGLLSRVSTANILVKLVYSKNYGTYGTAIEGHSTGGKHYPPQYGIFSEVKEFSGYMEMSENLGNTFVAGFVVAGDMGGLYYNSMGLLLKLKKTFK